jgi:hypothetical protein
MGLKATLFPDLKFGTEDKTQNTVCRVDQWLMDNAIAEAKAHGDEFNLCQFEHNCAKPSQADNDAAEIHMFDKENIFS